MPRDDRLSDDEIISLIASITARERDAAAAAGRFLRIAHMMADALTGTDRIEIASAMRHHAEALDADEHTRRRHAVH
jgi:hypothetical protein